MKKFLTFFVAICATMSLFAATEVEINVTSDISSWNAGGTDLYFQILNVKDQDNNLWNFVLDPALRAADYPWGTIMTENDDWEELSLKKGYVRCTDVHDFRFIAVMDGTTQRWELEAYATNGGVEYHIHAYHNLPEGGLFGGGDAGGGEEEEEEETTLDLVSNDMKDATADGNDIYIDKFTAKDKAGHTWSFCFDPKASGTHYPWGITMSLSDLDSNPQYTYVKHDGNALTLTSVSLFMDLNEDNGKPYLDATIVGTLDEKEYTVHVTANKPAPAAEINATKMTEKTVNNVAELNFEDAEGNTVSIDFKSATIYYDTIYTYPASISGISTHYQDRPTEAMNASALYNCKANFQVTKDESNMINITLSYTGNRDNKYVVTYSGAYSGTKIVKAVVIPDTIALSGEGTLEVNSMLGTLNYTLETADYTLVLPIMGNEYAGEYTQNDLKNATINDKAINQAELTISELTVEANGMKGYKMTGWVSSDAVENTIYAIDANFPYGKDTAYISGSYESTGFLTYDPKENPDAAMYTYESADGNYSLTIALPASEGLFEGTYTTEDIYEGIGSIGDAKYGTDAFAITEAKLDIYALTMQNDGFDGFMMMGTVYGAANKYTVYNVELYFPYSTFVPDTTTLAADELKIDSSSWEEYGDAQFTATANTIGATYDLELWLVIDNLDNLAGEYSSEDYNVEVNMSHVKITYMDEEETSMNLMVDAAEATITKNEDSTYTLEATITAKDGNVYIWTATTAKTTPTGISNTNTSLKAKKIIINGSLFIEREGKLYHANGQAL